MKTKKFDCVEMMHRGAEEVRKRIGNMTREQELEYWREQTERLRRMKRKARPVSKA